MKGLLNLLFCVSSNGGFKWKLGVEGWFDWQVIIRALSYQTLVSFQYKTSPERSGGPGGAAGDGAGTGGSAPQRGAAASHSAERGGDGGGPADRRGAAGEAPRCPPGGGED